MHLLILFYKITSMAIEDNISDIPEKSIGLPLSTEVLAQTLREQQLQDTGEYYCEHFLGFDNRQIPLEMIFQPDDQTQWRQNTYTRVDNLFFVNLHWMVEQGITPIQDPDGRIIYLQHLDEWESIDTLRFAAQIIHALQTLREEVSNEDMLDIGSSVGQLGIAAVWNGAHNVTCIEKESLEQQLRSNLILNGINSSRFSYIHADMNTINAQQIARIPQSTKIAMSNIGAYYEGRTSTDYVDESIAALLGKLDNVSIYIGGGYHNDMGKMGPQRVLEKLEQIGFTHNYREVTAEVGGIDRLTFIIERSV